MSNIAIAWNNIALNAVMTASSAASGLPVTNLLQEDTTNRKFRSGAGTSVAIGASYGAPNQSADTFALLQTNLSAAATVRVRLSSNDPTFATADIWDSGALSNVVDPLYKNIIVLAPTVKSGWRYFRIDIIDAGVGYIEAGFLFISTRTQFTYNYGWNSELTDFDPSIADKTIGGQTKISPRSNFRLASIAFPAISETQRWDAIAKMDRQNGRRLPALFLLDPASTNLGRDSIFGLAKESSPVAILKEFDGSGNPIYSRPYTIEERL